MLRRIDQNGNGVIDQEEMSGRSGGFVRGMAERAGLNPNEPIRVDRLAAAMQQGRGRDEGRDRGRDGDRNRDERGNNEDRGSSSGSGTTPTPAPIGVKGFGVAAGDGPRAPGFDVPLTATLGAPVEQRFDENVIDDVRDDYLDERDQNKNGVLERNEWSTRWNPPGDVSDLNKDGILSFEELCIRVAARRGNSRDSERSRDSRGGPTMFATSAGGSSQGDAAARLRQWATSMITRNDTNGDGMLQKDEWRNLPENQQAADTNPKDGVITVDEFVVHLQSYSAGGGGWGRGDRGGRSFGGGERGGFGGGERGGFGEGGYGEGEGGERSSSRTSSKPAGRKSYRAAPATERLPKGLPDFFLRNDADADGQISMVEFAASWSDRVAAEFAEYDLNGDGIITPEECLADDDDDR
jgi:hypothetical protein